MEKKEGKKVDWTPVLKKRGMLNLAGGLRRGIRHETNDNGLTAAEATVVLKTYAEWLETHQDANSLRNGPPELPNG